MTPLTKQSVVHACAPPGSPVLSPCKAQVLSPETQSPTERSLVYTCAPPPGWTVQRGITVPPAKDVPLGGKMCNVSGKEKIPAFAPLAVDGPDSAIWLCMLCQMDQPNAYPDFEMCHNCHSMYHFRISKYRELSWTCLRCQQGGTEPLLPRVCHHCHQEDDEEGQAASSSTMAFVDAPGMTSGWSVEA